MSDSQVTDNYDILNHPPAVAAVMVTYRIGDAVRPVIEAVLPEIGKLFIVDNGGDAETRATLTSMAEASQGRITLLFQPENNFAKAQNIGIEAALTEDFQWILLLDHDSRPAPGMVYQMLAAYRQHPFKEHIGLLAPYLQQAHSTRKPRYPQALGKFGFRMARFGKNDVLEDVISVVGSGSLIPRSVFARVGMMDTTLGLDYVDKDFCLRLHKSGYRILAVRSALLQHQLGDSRDHQWCGVTITATNHSAARRYSIYRNRIMTMRRYSQTLPAFCFYESVGIAYDLLRILLCEQDKKTKLTEIARGFKDGLVIPLEQHVPTA